jgi:hypothetical protein
MRTIYLRRDHGSFIRKIVVEIGYLITNKKLRLPKYYYEEELYLPYNPKDDKDKVENYYLTRDKIIDEDEDHYFFDFPFKPAQVENAAV